MKNNHPISSQELNDRLLTSYEYLVYLLGQNYNGPVYTGVYERLEVSGVNLVTSLSGIPSANMSQLITMLKMDYFYRKNFNQIIYKDNK